MWWTNGYCIDDEGDNIEHWQPTARKEKKSMAISRHEMLERIITEDIPKHPQSNPVLEGPKLTYNWSYGSVFVGDFLVLQGG